MSNYKCIFQEKLKLMPAIFYKSFIFSPNVSPSETIKMFFMSLKKLFLLSRYSIFCNFSLPFHTSQ